MTAADVLQQAAACMDVAVSAALDDACKHGFPADVLPSGKPLSGWLLRPSDWLYYKMQCCSWTRHFTCKAVPKWKRCTGSANADIKVLYPFALTFFSTGFLEHVDTDNSGLFQPQVAATTWCCYRTALQLSSRHRWRQGARARLRCWARTSFLPRRHLPASMSGVGAGLWC